MRALAVVLLVGACAPVRAQTPSGPVNDRPNPYTTNATWATMPAGRTWGSTSAVAVDIDGKSIWVFERCGQNSCATSDLDPILKFDENGKLVRSFGKGLFIFPHGIDVDREGNVWVVDCACIGRAPVDSANPRGHQIVKFSPEGRELMRLGQPAGGRGEKYFWQPNDVLIAPNGDIFVAEGHSSAAGANARILKFDKTGKLLKSWGEKGAGRGQLDQPHALALDSRGRLFVGDRSNNRIVIYDQDGTWLDEWYQFSRPSGIAITKDDVIYVADSESGSVAPGRPEWTRGIRIGSARTGQVTAFIPDPDRSPPSTSAAEGVAVDAKGNVYGAEVGPKALKRYEKR